MDGNNGLGGWTPQPVSLNASQAANTLVMGQAGVFSNRTVVSVPPGSSTSVVLLVPPGSSTNVEIKDRQVVVTTLNTIYMPAPMTPQSGQILFDRGVATLAQNKGYSIPEAAGLADKGMQWARANFGSDYRQAESQFMNWINGAPDRANNPNFQNVADSVQSEPDIKTSQSSAQAHHEEVGPTPAGLKGAHAPGDSAVSDDPIYATVDRPSTAPAGSVSEKIAASEEEAAAITNRPATAPASLSSGEAVGQDSSLPDDYLDGVAELFAEAETAVDSKNTVASGESNDDAASAPASESVTVDRPFTAPASMSSGEMVEQDSSLPDDYLDGVAELFAEAETAVDSKNTVASGESNDDAASAPASENVTVDRPFTAPASMSSGETVEQDSSLPDDYLDGVAELFAEAETAVDSKNTVASGESNDDAASAPASENVTVDRPFTAPASMSSGETVEQDSSLPDDYLDGVAELFAEAETAVDNKNTVASGESNENAASASASENVTVDRPFTAPASVSSGETVEQDSSLPDDYLDGVAELFAEAETAVDSKNTVASGESNDDAASAPASENVTVDRPFTAPASMSSGETVEQDSSLPDDYLDGVAELFAEAETTVDSKNTVASGKPNDDAASAPASENVTVDRPFTAPASVSSGETVEQDSSLPDDYLDGVAELFAGAETTVDSKNQKAYIPDIDVPRSKPNDYYLTLSCNPMLHHLKEKYGTEFLMNIDFNSPEILIRDCGNQP